MMNNKNFEELLREFRRLNIQEAINFKLMNEVLISHHSTAIEGSSLTEEESRLLLTEGITAKGKPLQDHNMVKDHQTALEEIVRLAGERKKVSPEMLQQISAMVMKNTGSVINDAAGSYDSSLGDFRKSMVHVGDRYFIDYQKVPGAVQKLCDEVNKRLNMERTPREIYNLAFDAHFNLVGIHPFADGNGRVSRLLMNYILEYHRQPMAIVYKEDKQEYFHALEQARKDETQQPFREFMYSQQCKYFSGEITKVKESGLNLNLDFDFEK